MAYPTSGQTTRSGPVVGTDVVLQPKPNTWLNRSNEPIPFGIHSNVQAILAPDLKSLAWGTGIALYTPPRPVSAYAIGGTNLHLDYVNNYWSFGNFHPYVEVGIASTLGPRRDGVERGFFATLAMEANVFVHYLAFTHEDERKTDGFIMIKFGIGYERY
jgi:hypothetical protein